MLTATKAREYSSFRGPAIAPVSTRTPDGTTNLVVASRELTRDGTAWVQARLATLPNGRLGWVPRSALGGWEFVDTRVAVDRARLSLTPYRDGAVVFRAPVGIGKPSTPTPDGLFYVRDRLTDYPSRSYGPLAFGTSARSPYDTGWPAGGFIGIHGLTAPASSRAGSRTEHPIAERRDSEIGQTDATRDPRYGSVTGRKRDWRKLVGALLVAVVVVAGAPTAVADGGSTSSLKTLTTQFPLGGQKLCCRSHSRAPSLRRDSAGSATGQGGRAGSGTSVVFVGSVALVALLLFLLGRELSATFRAPNIGRPSRASRILEAVDHRAWLIDRIRHAIQERLEQLVAEAEKLRRALAALDPRAKPKPKSTPKSASKRTPKPAERSALAAPEPRADAPRQRAPSSGEASLRARTAPGSTKAKVLGALSTDRAMTAGDVAKATGLARGTVSPTLTKLAKTGEISKAERGYRLPAPR